MDIGQRAWPEDRPLIGWVRSYTPDEIILAAGCQPLRLSGTGEPSRKAVAFLHPSLCPYVRSVLDQALEEMHGPDGMRDRPRQLRRRHTPPLRCLSSLPDAPPQLHPGSAQVAWSSISHAPFRPATGADGFPARNLRGSSSEECPAGATRSTNHTLSLSGVLDSLHIRTSSVGSTTPSLIV
jgi:hypothetical protein